MKKLFGVNLAALAICGFVHADVNVQEQVVGPAISPDGWAAVGRTGGHVAIITPKGSRCVVVYDGLEGPKFDRIALVNHRHTENNVAPGGEDQHILFSADGSRMAYVGQDGGDFVVMVDGKELGRYKQPVEYLTFSPGGKHVCYQTQTGDPNAWLFVDGHGGPMPAAGSVPAYSTDEAHYLYSVVNAATHQMNPFIDGKATAYSGHDFLFSGDGNHVLGIDSDRSGDSLLMDGKAVSKVPGATLELAAAPQGLHFSYIQHQQDGDLVRIDGQKIDGTDPRQNKVIFSPDGNHAAVICGSTTLTGGKAWVIVDGKKQPAYEVVQKGFFTPDSSKFIYTAMNNNKLFLVVNGVEGEGHARIEDFTMDPAGNHCAFSDQMKTFVDEKPVGPAALFGGVVFSPDGSHYAFVHDDARHLINQDGVDLKGLAFTTFGVAGGDVKPRCLLFSPDSKHFVCAASSQGSAGKKTKGVAIDSALFPVRDDVSRPLFTPDSQHLVWVTLDPKQHNPNHEALFLDGKQVLLFDRSIFDELPGACTMGSDGKLTLIALADGSIKRFTVTPSSETSVVTLITSAQTASQAESTDDSDQKPKKKHKTN